MTLQVMPDKELMKRGWCPKQRFIFSEPDFLYAKNDLVYGWFDRGAAWREELKSEEDDKK